MLESAESSTSETAQGAKTSDTRGGALAQGLQRRHAQCEAGRSGPGSTAASAAARCSEAALGQASVSRPSPAQPSGCFGAALARSRSRAVAPRGSQRLSGWPGWECRVPAGLRNQGAGLSLSASPQSLESPQVSSELLTPAVLAEFLLHYSALRWPIPVQPRCRSRPYDKQGPHLF